MIKKRIGTDLFLRLSVTVDDKAVDLSAAENVKVTVTNRWRTSTVQTFSIEGNAVVLQWSSDFLAERANLKTQIDSDCSQFGIK